MAVDILLKLGDIDGDSKIEKHEGEIDVLSWSFGMSQSGTMHQGGGGGSGKVAIQDLTITKYVDPASINLIRACCNGNHMEEGELVVRKVGGASPINYFTIKMTEVMVTSISTGGSGGEDRLTENVTLNFATVKVIYTAQKDDGSPDAESSIHWNIQGNSEI